MVGYPPNSMEVDQCFVTVHWWVKIDLFVLVWRPLLQGRIWKSSLSLPVITDDDDMIGSITTRFVSLPLCYLGFSLVSTKAKTLSSTTISVSCAYGRHHHYLYNRRPPFLSMPLILLLLPLFLVVSRLLQWMGSIWNVKRLTIWLGFEIWAFGWFCRSKKKKKNSKSTDWEMLVKERKMKELKRVFL